MELCPGRKCGTRRRRCQTLSLDAAEEDTQVFRAKPEDHPSDERLDAGSEQTWAVRKRGHFLGLSRALPLSFLSVSSLSRPVSVALTLHLSGHSALFSEPVVPSPVVGVRCCVGGLSGLGEGSFSRTVPWRGS